MTPAELTMLAEEDRDFNDPEKAQSSASPSTGRSIEDLIAARGLKPGQRLNV